jgi:hypothetical protein
MVTNNTAPTPPTDDTLPRYSASEQPVTRGSRIAFQVWVYAALLTVVIALVLYLVDKLILR